MSKKHSAQNQNPNYNVAIFNSTSEVLLAEKLMKKAGIPYKLIPVPRHLSSDCGICLRFFPQHEKQVKEALSGKIEAQGIYAL